MSRGGSFMENPLPRKNSQPGILNPMRKIWKILGSQSRKISMIFENLKKKITKISKIEKINEIDKKI